MGKAKKLIYLDTREHTRSIYEFMQQREDETSVSLTRSL